MPARGFFFRARCHRPADMVQSETEAQRTCRDRKKGAMALARSLSYYRETGSDCNVALNDREMVVNCAGQTVMQSGFTADRPQGRLDYYLMYLTRGALTIRLDGEETPFRAGEACILAPGVEQHYVFDGRDELNYFWVHFTGSAARACVERAGLPIGRTRAVGLDEALVAAFQSLMDSFIIADAWQEEEAAGRLMVLLSGLGRAAAGRPVRPAIEPIRRSLSHMEASYGEPITVADLAQMEFMSVSRYSALFRSCTGLAPKEYLIRLRMRSAMEMLTRTNMSVSQIARAVGYEDPLYFSRLFKKHMGASPRAVRRR